MVQTILWLTHLPKYMACYAFLLPKVTAAVQMVRLLDFLTGYWKNSYNPSSWNNLVFYGNFLGWLLIRLSLIAKITYLHIGLSCFRISDHMFCMKVTHSFTSFNSCRVQKRVHHPLHSIVFNTISQCPLKKIMVSYFVIISRAINPEQIIIELNDYEYDQGVLLAMTWA